MMPKRIETVKLVALLLAGGLAAGFGFAWAAHWILSTLVIW